MKRSSYRFGGEARIDSIDMAGILMLLSRGGGGGRGGGDGGAGDESRVFECKTCSRRFPSYQALGGHRASHKKPRLGDKAPKQRSHECSVCGLEFAAGQALGGHMRRHRVPSSSLFERGAEVAVPASGTAVVEREGIRGVVLDLNLPAPQENSVVDLKLGLGLTTNLVESVDN